MLRRVVSWPIKRLCELQDDIDFPTFQREANLWANEKNKLLIDSILEEIDIPKLYFSIPKAGQYEVIDGQQRLWAIWRFVEGEFAVSHRGLDCKFKDLPQEARMALENYQLQVVEISDADDEYLRKLFMRLQLGTILVAGEKLHALTGHIRDFIFKREIGLLPFLRTIDIQARRFARETLFAQICINSFERALHQDFSRTRYEDLHYFFEKYSAPSGEVLTQYENLCGIILRTLESLDQVFGEKAEVIHNRSMALSVYLLGEELLAKGALVADYPVFVEALIKALDAEVKKGMERTNESLYKLEGYLSSAPAERYQIERRHILISDLYAFFLSSGQKIRGV